MQCNCKRIWLVFQLDLGFFVFNFYRVMLTWFIYTHSTCICTARVSICIHLHRYLHHRLYLQLYVYRFKIDVCAAARLPWVSFNPDCLRWPLQDLNITSCCISWMELSKSSTRGCCVSLTSRTNCDRCLYTVLSHLNMTYNSNTSPRPIFTGGSTSVYPSHSSRDTLAPAFRN